MFVCLVHTVNNRNTERRADFFLEVDYYTCFPKAISTLYNMKVFTKNIFRMRHRINVAIHVRLQMQACTHFLSKIFSSLIHLAKPPRYLVVM